MTISEDITGRSVLLFEAPAPAAPAAATGTGQAATAGSAIQLSVHASFAGIEEEWRAFEAVADCTAFQTFAWHDAWQRHVGALGGVQPAVVVGRSESGILFIAPLAVEQTFAARRLVWHAWQLCDYNAPLLAPGFAERVSTERFAGLWRQILALLQGDPRFVHDMVMLRRMPGEVGTLKNPFVQLSVTPHASSAYAMAVSGDWETFYRNKRSSATRRHARAKLKNLSAIGVVSLATAGASRDVKSVLATLFEQKAVSFARMGVANFLMRPGYRDFYCAVASSPENFGLVHVSELRVGETRSAANLGMVFRGRYYHVLASHGGGEEIERFGPGTAHLHMLMAYAIERGCDTFDFTIGDESYKRDWCEQYIPLWDLCHAASMRGMVYGAGWMVAARLKRFIKQSAPLWNFYTFARRKIGSAIGRPVARATDEASHDG